MFENVFEMFTANLWAVASALWGLFAVYLVWYLTRAKDYSPITPGEARQLWAIHRDGVHCNSTRWKKVERGGQIVGFRCDCGFKYLQRRPLVASAPAVLVDPQVSAFDRLHTTHNPS
jgi:hypothetical protein